jgi:hypothetical protein
VRHGQFRLSQARNEPTVEEFRKALDNGLSAPVQGIVSRQYAQIKEVHDRVKHLRDAAKKS